MTADIVDGVGDWFSYCDIWAAMLNTRARNPPLPFSGRIPLDLDTPDKELVFETAVRLIRNEKNVSRVEVWRSSSGMGHHIIGVLNEPVPCWQQFALRRKYGDDERRIAHSVKNVQIGLKIYDVLFTTKFWADGSSSDAKPLYEIRKTGQGFELEGLNEQM